ncbi:MAG: site-specific integrase [bacterium]|nr:site-specific integrase [bacterium]
MLAECTGKMTYLNDIITCAINTGLRKTELLTLKWDQIRNGQLYIKGKGEKRREVPINDDMSDLLKDIRRREGLRSNYVFTYQGQPITNTVENSFKSALRRAGIENFRFHDLRHTFASWFVMRGGDLKTLQEILGHSDIATTMRYAHLSKAHKAKSINLVSGLTSRKNKAPETSSDFVRKDAFSVIFEAV